jgi:hypothetical protein
MKEEKKFERIGVQLSDADVLRLGREMAEKNQAVLKLEAEKKEAMAGFQDKINALHAEVNDLSKQIAEKVTEKEIEVTEEPDDGRKLMIVKERESGRMLRTRKMTLDEIVDSEFRLNGGATNGVHDTEPPPDAEKPKAKRTRRVAAVEANEELGD